MADTTSTRPAGPVPQNADPSAETSVTLVDAGATDDVSTRSARRWLAFFIVVATLLRVWGLGYGLPHPLTRPDEERVVGAAMSIASGATLHPGDFMYPGLMKYVAGAVLSAYFNVGRGLGWFVDFDDFDRQLKAEEGLRNYLVCRAVSVLFGVLTVIVTYGLAREVAGTRSAGLLAAWLIAVCYLHARDSHFATVDVTATFFATLSLWFAARFARQGSRSALGVASMAAGLAAASKYNVGLVAIGVTIACLFRAAAPNPASRVRSVALAGLAVIAAFALGSPYSLLHHGEVLDMLAFVKGKLMAGEGPSAFEVHLRHSFPEGLGWPLFLASLAGIAYAARKRRVEHWVALGFVILFFASISPARWVVPRYVIPLLPAVFALASTATLAAVNRQRGAFVVVLGVVLGVPTLSDSIEYGRVASAADTRLLAAQWIESNLTPSRGIAVCAGYGAPEINADSTRGPWFRVKQIDCESLEPQSLTRPYLVTHEHPYLPWSFSKGTFERLLGKDWRRIALFDPFDGGSGKAATYSTGDAFFMPYSGLSSVTRGGPIIAVWERLRDP
jgi:hypothetical protein